MRLARFGRPAAKDIHHCVDPETGIVYVAYSTAPGEGVLVEISDLQSPFPAVNELVTFPPENDVHADRWGQVVGVKFLVDIQAICVVFSHGDVALFHKERTETGETLEIVGSVDSGILCMAWSPDDELVVMVTGEGSILEMTKDFDVIAENQINVEEAGEDVSVNVGWGKKETQFHGSEGKVAAQRKVDASTFTYSPDDDQRPRLSWRGDGTYFSCSTMDSQYGRRVIRVYNREAVLQNTSEAVDMLEHSLSWRPSGNLIASSQRLPHRHDIVFFERNGLRHGEFSLREDKETVVKEVLWNCDSTVLAVWLERTNGSCVQLWMMNNYHWYLKQEIVFGEEGCHAASVQWDVEAALVIHIVTENGSYQRHDYCWDHFVNEMHSPENAGSVAVIDGANLLLTPFKLMNVPPPMSAFSIKLPYAIQHVSFSTTNGGDDMAVLLADQRLAFLGGMDKSVRPLPEPRLLGIVETAIVPSTLIRQIAWVREDTLIGLQYDSDSASDVLLVFRLSFDDETRAPKIESRSELPLDGQFQRLYFNQTYGDILLHQANGNLMRIVLDEEQQQQSEPRVEPLHEIHGGLTEGCLWIGTARVGTSPEPQYRDLAVIGLTRNNRLYVNERLISTEATSFSLHNHLLAFTTATHTARFLPLETSLSELKVVDNSSLPYDESVRRVERGSRIVLAAPHSVNLVLQMPRGNLETIAPRAMVLSATRDALDKKDFRTALVTCRKHRIDLNLLYDHNPQQFMENVGEFVRQVKDVDYLNLFLSFLRNEDVTKTLYPVTGTLTTSPPPAFANAKGVVTAAAAAADPEKVNTICEAVRKELETMDRKTYINTILTTHVRMTPPNLESALTLLAELRGQDAALAEEALKFTIFLADVNRLFDVALGMYDFGLVLMVAQYSQKDPREYLPFLNELRALEKYYQRFRIDDHLKRHARALTHLSQAGEKYFEACLAYTKQHGLYKEAIKIYRPMMTSATTTATAVKYKAVLKIHGDHLSSKGDMDQAGLAYSMAGDKEAALEAYKTGHFWREAVVLAQQLDYDKAAMTYLASTMADSLRGERRFSEAAVLLADYARDTEEAMAALLEGRLWSEATRLAHVSQRLDLMETHVLPGIGEGHQEIMDTVREMKEQLEKQIKRLAEVRELRIKKMLAEQQQAAAAAGEMGHEDMLDNVDMMSDTTSMASGFSRYTKANTVGTRNTSSSRQSAYTARLRRRQERKRQTGKKGSIFEEEYLIGSLRKLIVRIDAFKLEVAAMLKALAGCMLLQRADALQAEFSSLLGQVDQQIPGIFLPAPQEHLERKKAQQEAIAERKKLTKQLSANAHQLSRQEEAVLQAQIAQLDEVVDDEIAEIYGEPPVLSKESWMIDVI
ncbi:hypothetical protein DFQ26_001667 [Actinomortierella ambigua]|nr:hypothetical protein DFQ26_001667 [Actinomortierella ambigua]